MPDDSEELRIIEACAQGDWREFSYLFEKYRDRVYALALAIVKDSALARDVAQASFIKIYRSVRWFNRRSKFSTWVYRIAYHEALDQYRRRGARRESVLGEDSGDGTLRSEKGALFGEVARRDEGERVRAALESLPVKLRTAATLKYVEGLSYSEICGILGCARGVLQKRLARASEKLRRLLRDTARDA